MLEMAFHTLYGAVLMLWETFWALVLGFACSALLQVLVRRESMMQHSGQASLRSVGLATFLGAVSSSCSYAAAAAARAAYQKGAHLIPTLAFMFAATNLVLELVCVLWIFLGWHFVLAEAVGAFVLIGIMWLLVALTLPRGLMEQARTYGNATEGGDSCCHAGAHEHHGHGGHHHTAPGSTGPAEAKATQVASAFFMDVGMMWKEILIGFLIASILMTFVPPDAWKVLFLSNAPAPIRLVENAVVGVLIAMASFVCSVGNLPLAAALWSGGISFGGVISFIYADLVIIPLLLIYRKYYGLKAAAYIAAILASSMVLAGIVVDLLFSALGLMPQGARPPSPLMMAQFQWNYTTWLDVVALAVLALLAWLHFSKKPGAEPAFEHAGMPPTGSHATH
jgi:uncharacterized membrane protein YraQ (UPF0718 family)